MTPGNNDRGLRTVLADPAMASARYCLFVWYPPPAGAKPRMGFGSLAEAVKAAASPEYAKMRPSHVWDAGTGRVVAWIETAADVEAALA